MKLKSQSLKKLYNSRLNGLAYCKIVTDEKNNPIDYIFLDVNETYEKLTGIKKMRVIGKRVTDVFPGYEKSNAKYLRIFGKVALENKEVRFERDHELFGHSYSIYSFSPQKGYFISIFSDITKHIETEKALKESEEKFRIITKNTPDHILMQDIDLRYTFIANPQMGLSEKDMLGKTDFEILKRKDALALTKIKKRVMRTGKPEYLTAPIISHSGDTEYFEGSYMPKRGSGGQIEGIIGYFRNITGRKQMEFTLQKKNKELQNILDSVPAMVFYKDKINNFIRTNKAFENAMGMSKKELEGKSLFDIYPKKQASAFWKDDKEVMKSGKAKSGIIEPMETAAGIKFVQTEKIPYADEHGDIIGVIGFAIDITERKKNEDKISKLTRLYSVLSQANEVIIRIRDEKIIFSKICQIVAEDGRFPLVWIGKEKNHEVVPIAWHGTAFSYLKEIKVETQGKLGQGPTGTSIRENRAVINDDFAYNSKLYPWRKPALSYGFRSSAAFPLCLHGKAIASLTIYSSEPKAFDRDQVRLLESLSANISYALDKLNQEQLKKQAEKKIEHLASFPRLNPNPIIEVDLSGKIVFANEGCKKFLEKTDKGYKLNDFLPNNLNQIIKRLLKNKSDKQEIYEQIQLGNSYFSERFYLTPNFDTIRIYIHDITKRKIIEEKLANTQVELKRRMEQQLVDSYQHLGEINRRISLLLELEKHSSSKTKKQDIADYILTSAINLSRAKIGFLYILSEKDQFNLLSSKGISKSDLKNIKTVSEKSLGHIRHALRIKSRTNGITDHDGTSFEKFGKKMTYCVTLPLLNKKKPKGFIHLGFDDIISLDSQELEFLDVFAIHSSSALANAKFI
jgi:PAS domain S-box-containing protein